jgi:hypothetical protein
LRAMRHITLSSAALLCWLLVSPLAGAGELGPHGGPMADTLPYNVELIVKDGELRLFAFDDKSSAPVSAKDAKATATILIGDQKQTVDLAPAADDEFLLSGHFTGAAAAGIRVVVVVRFPDQRSIVARFVI